MEEDVLNNVLKDFINQVKLNVLHVVAIVLNVIMQKYVKLVLQVDYYKAQYVKINVIKVIIQILSLRHVVNVKLDVLIVRILIVV